MPKLTLTTALVLTTLLGAGTAVAQTRPPGTVLPRFDPLSLHDDDAIRVSNWVIDLPRRARADEIRVGAVIRGSDDRYLGRIASVDGSGATVSHNGDRTTHVPMRSLWHRGGSLMVPMNRTAFVRMASRSHH